MKISVKDAFTSYTYNKIYDFKFSTEQFDDLPASCVGEGVNAKVTVSSESGVVTCTICVNVVFEAFCSRCLKSFEMPLSFEVKKLVRCEMAEDFDDVIYTDAGYFIDITEEIRTQIYFEFPTKPLCIEDCKGLCPVCGCDLNVKSCSCDIKTVDPRLAVLKNLFD